MTSMSGRKDFKETRRFLHGFHWHTTFDRCHSCVSMYFYKNKGALMVYQTKVIGSAFSLSLIREAYFIYYLNCRVEVKMELSYRFGLDNPCNNNK